jgi:HEAT repeat protein
LKKLAEDQEPAVVALAVARLIEIDPELVVPAVERLLGSADAHLRSLGVEVLFRRPTEKHVRLLGDRLDDLHPDVRLAARRSLLELAGKKEFHDPVITEATRMLATKQWRALEQATTLLTLLDHKPAASRLVELLAFPRPEVFITAAWGLRKLAVRETLPAIVKYVEAQQARARAAAVNPNQKEVPLEVLDHQLSQLIQFLGKEKHAPADAVLRQFIPRMEKPMTSVACPESRAAAIWALGMIHDGKPLPAVATALVQRLEDTGSLPPEDSRVRRMSAITLGRLQAQEALPSLRKMCPAFEPSEEPVSNACGWAIEQLTGTLLPEPKPIQKLYRDEFLMPQD